MIRMWGYRTLGEAKGRQSRSGAGVVPYECDGIGAMTASLAALFSVALLQTSWGVPELERVVPTREPSAIVAAASYAEPLGVSAVFKTYQPEMLPVAQRRAPGGVPAVVMPAFAPVVFMAGAAFGGDAQTDAREDERFVYEEPSKTTPAEEQSGGSITTWAVVVLVLMLAGVIWRRRQEEAAARVMDGVRKRQRAAAYENAFREMAKSKLGDFLCGTSADRSIATVMNPASGRVESLLIAWAGAKEESGFQSVKRIYCDPLALHELHGVRLFINMEQGISKKLKISEPEVTGVVLHIHTGHAEHPYFRINLLERACAAGAPEVVEARDRGWKWVALLEGATASHANRPVEDELSRLREDLEAGLLTEEEYAVVEKRLRRRVTVALNL